MSKRKSSRAERKTHLDKVLKSLHHRTILIEEELKELESDRFYRTCIFGSARIKEEDEEYEEVFQLGRILAWRGIDILTGGGPGLMEAANKGAKLGQEEKNTKSMSVGLTIELEWEPEANNHLDIKRHHQRFSSRLDDFMRLSHSVICTPGGIGTVLELFFTWQLIQVKHLQKCPIVLLDESFWSGLLDWFKNTSLKRGLVSAKDFDFIHIVDTPDEAFEIISKHHDEFLKKNK